MSVAGPGLGDHVSSHWFTPSVMTGKRTIPSRLRSSASCHITAMQIGIPFSLWVVGTLLLVSSHSLALCPTPFPCRNRRVVSRLSSTGCRFRGPVNGVLQLRECNKEAVGFLLPNSIVPQCRFYSNGAVLVPAWTVEGIMRLRGGSGGSAMGDAGDIFEGLMVAHDKANFLAGIYDRGGDSFDGPREQVSEKACCELLVLLQYTENSLSVWCKRCEGCF